MTPRWAVARVATATAAVAALALAACGGGSDGAGADGGSAGASDEFCDRAADFQEATTAVRGIASAEEMQAAVDQLEDVAAEAPSQMDDEFSALIGVLDQLVVAMRSASSGSNADTIEAMRKVLTPETTAEVEDASRNVEAFLEVECDIPDEEVAGAGGAAAAPPTSTPAGDPAALGADPALGPLATACHDGDMASCDELYFASPSGSPYEAYGNTCGQRTTIDEYCVDLYPAPATGG